MAIVSDNDIVKALECCIDYDCKNCTADDCKDPLRQALSLINRQKAEIERLQEQHKLAVAEREANVKGFTENLKTAKADGIIEFWGTLKARNTMDERIVSVVTGDNLVKEMVGDGNG